MNSSDYELEKAIKKNVDFINSLFSIIKKQRKHIERLQTRNQRQPDFYRFKIIKAILKLICAGLDEESALQEVAADYKGILTVDGIKTLWRDSRRGRNALDLYARTYMVKKMRISGYMIADIEQTMSISITSVRRLLKQSDSAESN